MSWPSTIWNCAAVSGSPRIASDAVPATSDRRYLWKLGSSCIPLLNKLKVCAQKSAYHRTNEGIAGYEGWYASGCRSSGGWRASTARCTWCTCCGWCRSALKTLRIVLVGYCADPARRTSCRPGPSLDDTFRSASSFVYTDCEILT